MPVPEPPGPDLIPEWEPRSNPQRLSPDPQIPPDPAPPELWRYWTCLRAKSVTTSRPEAAPQPQPEHDEPSLPDPTLIELSLRDYRAIVVRASKEALDDHITNLAAAIAYYSFLAIPSLLLVAVGLFSLFASPDAIGTITEKLAGVVPREALTLVDDSLTRVIENNASSGIAMALVGTVLAAWSLTGAMQTLMWALNSAYEREETRGFLKRRLTALVMVILMLFAFVLAFALLVLARSSQGG